MRTGAVAQMHARVWTKRFIKSFGAALSPAAFKRRIESPGLVVLMYHRVNAYRKNELSVKPEEFRKQMQWLSDHGFENTRMADLESGSVPPLSRDQRVIITFDDGYEDNFLVALTVLKEFAYSAIFYLPVDYISSSLMAPRDRRESNVYDQNRRMTWEQARRLIAERMEIGSHGMSHARLTDLSLEEARREIRGSKAALEKELSIPVTSFCYPGGRYRAEHVTMVREAGYRSACTASPGTAPGTKPFEIPRVAVQASDTFFVFRRKLEGRMGWLRVVR